MARRRNKRDDKGGMKAGLIWVGSLVILFAGLVGGYMMLKKSQSDNATEKETGCLSDRPTPEAVLFMVDTTDRLSEKNADHVVTSIRDMAGALPRYSRVIVVPFANDVAAPLTPVFSQCLPGHGKDARLDESARLVEDAYGKFESALNELDGKLKSLSDAPTSPITQQIINAASNPALHWTGESKTLVLFSDGLESTIYWTKELRLKAPPTRILDRVKVEYHELGNTKNSRLQTVQLREQWREWFDKAGATVKMTAPGYASN
jgi:hypothetical protein